MKQFIIKIFKFTLPLTLIISTVIYIDFFKIFGFQDYYSNQEVRGLNRGMITSTTFNHYREIENFDSFIFGSSRSQAFKCKNWIQYLDKNTKPFHFDASSENIWGLTKKVEYIDELKDTIKNALVIIDRTTLTGTSPMEGPLYISTPFISKSSKTEYYLTFLKASLNLKFLTAYIDYSIFKTYRSYMGSFIKKSKYSRIANNKNCDVWYGLDKEIEYDSLRYYTKKVEEGVFYPRTGVYQSECNVTLKERNQLQNIKNIFKKHNTKYAIIISPTYDQLDMEKSQIQLLEEIFGEENIYNYSGKNKFTESIYNFYENSHYRPSIANKIMEMIYIK